MPTPAPFVAWPSAAILLALAVRALAVLWADHSAARRGACACSRGGRAGEFIHAVMAIGMATCLVPLRPPVPFLAGLFAASAVLPAGRLVTRRLVRRWRARDRRPERPAAAGVGSAVHRAVLALVMIWMLARPGALGGMAGMTMPPTAAIPGVLALAYVWLAVLVLGAGMARAVATVAAPSAPATPPFASRPLGYACELMMTLLMGIMLLT